MRSNKTRFILLAVLFTVGLTATYWNHFDNGFYFDDIHTIVNNEYVHSLDYLPEYFTGIEAFGTMPTNRGYRPIVVLLNAIDYQLAGGKLDQVVFHISIWFWYLVQGLLLYLFIAKMFVSVMPERDMRFPALLTTAFYMFHTGNAETVNYIISRSDSFSATMMLAGFVLFQHERTRKFQLHLLPFIIAMFTKEVSFMFVPLVGLYHYFFMNDGDLLGLKTIRGWKKAGSSLLVILPIAVVGVGLLAMNLLYMTDTARLSNGLTHPRMDYFTSQFVVVARYIGNFVLPTDLSADPDLKVTAGFSSAKLWGFLIIGILHALAIYSLIKKQLLPIGFGIAWFFICLAPTSTLNPMYQVANDHRAFLPYIGLCISVGWGFYLLYDRRPALKKAILALTFIAICGHAYGSYQRNEVWGSEETLWRDATIKSPNNGRGLMNYGLVLMRKGDYKDAEPYFEKAVELLPYWPYSNVNMAILKSAMGKDDEAKTYFETALRYGSDNPEPYYYYAKWHFKRGDSESALDLLQRGHDVSPKHTNINQFLGRLQTMGVSPEDRAERLRTLAEKTPSADNYLNLSLALYKSKDYNGCIAACKRALTFNPEYALAYNNMCSAYNQMQQWDAAIDACQQALQIDLDFERAKNNLNWAKKELKKQ